MLTLKLFCFSCHRPDSTWTHHWKFSSPNNGAGYLLNILYLSWIWYKMPFRAKYLLFECEGNPLPQLNKVKVNYSSTQWRVWAELNSKGCLRWCLWSCSVMDCHIKKNLAWFKCSEWFPNQHGISLFSCSLVLKVPKCFFVIVFFFQVTKTKTWFSKLQLAVVTCVLMGPYSLNRGGLGYCFSSQRLDKNKSQGRMTDRSGHVSTPLVCM